MKTIFTLCLLCLSLSLQAQKLIEKEIDYSGEQVNLNLKFASEIELTVTDEAKIKLKAWLKTSHEHYTEMIDLEISEETGEINISSNTQEVFQAFQDNELQIEGGLLYTNNLDHEFIYQIQVPKHIKLAVSSITANISSPYFTGELTTDLFSGDIYIENFEGVLALNTVSGNIEIPVLNSSIQANTIVGNIEVDKEFDYALQEKFVGKELKLSNANYTNSAKIKSVNGLIKLR
ncbi:hypothetical protein ACW6QP_01925 [Salegentibacter sp. HM20]